MTAATPPAQQGQTNTGAPTPPAASPFGPHARAALIISLLTPLGFAVVGFAASGRALWAAVIVCVLGILAAVGSGAAAIAILRERHHRHRLPLFLAVIALAANGVLLIWAIRALLLFSSGGL